MNVTVYRCPVHGIIEQPVWFSPPYGGDEAGWYCPINLSTNESGITDDVCDKRCEGPFEVTVHDLRLVRAP